MALWGVEVSLFARKCDIWISEQRVHAPSFCIVVSHSHPYAVLQNRDPIITSSYHHPITLLLLLRLPLGP